MKEQLQNLQDLRTKLAAAVAEKKEIAGVHSKELEPYSDKVKGLEAQITELTTEITPLALAEYAETKSKKLTGGLGIKVMSKISYDAKKAFAWALDKKMAISLDKKAFEKMFKTGTTDISFVTESKIDTVTFPKELVL